MRNVETCCRRGDWGLYWFSMTRELISLLKCETLKYEIWNYEIWEYQIYEIYELWEYIIWTYICRIYESWKIWYFGFWSLSDKWEVEMPNMELTNPRISNYKKPTSNLYIKNAIKKDWNMPAPAFLKLYWKLLEW